MKTLKGVIGWDINGKEYADMISRLSGDIDIEIDSPGGYVTDGISIFNALKRYDKGKVNIHVVGECSSMAAYIMLAGDTLKLEPNAIIVLHNPFGGVCGDYRTMLAEAEVLEKMTKLYAAEFVKKGIFDEKTIRNYMDCEKWFIGADDLKIFGEVIERDIPQLEKIEKEAKASVAIKNIRAWQAQAQKSFKENLNGVAALISDIQFDNEIVSTQKAEKDGTKEPAAQVPQNNERGKIMDLKELQEKHPDIYAQVTKVGAEQEQKRVKALMQFIEDDKETVIQAINDGKSIHDEEVFAKLTRARINANIIQAMEGENPPAVNPKEPVHEKEKEPEKTEEEKQQEQEEKENQEVAENLKKMGLA